MKIARVRRRSSRLRAWSGQMTDPETLDYSKCKGMTLGLAMTNDYRVAFTMADGKQVLGMSAFTPDIARSIASRVLVYCDQIEKAKIGDTEATE